jgi:hypothetical protein
MLEHLGDGVSSRALWLFGCACCRRIWSVLRDPRSRALIELREQLDTDTTSGEGVRAALNAAQEVINESTERVMDGLGFEEVIGPHSPWDRHAPEVAPEAAAKAAYSAASPQTAGWLANVASDHVANVVRCLHLENKDAAHDHERAAHCDLLRDIFGNPFRPVAFSPNWRTDTAVTLARTMYEAREFSAMPILADALQDAGCDSADILAHCRDPHVTHVRGCWMADLVLGKE